MRPYLGHGRLKRYQGQATYALITGATDGIGKAIARELALNGFNLVIHGRNMAKLQAVAEELSTEFPNCRIAPFLHDGSISSKIDISSITRLPINILVNNAGVGPIGRLTDLSNRQIDEIIILNTVFPSQLTHDLLPHLRLPALVLNISSYAGLLPPPFLSVYAGTKAFNNAFSISLSRELDQVEVISIIAGSVNSGSNRKPVTFMRPSAETFAKAIIKVIGCGRKSIVPYWPHALQVALVSLFPQKVIDRFTRKAMKKELNDMVA